MPVEKRQGPRFMDRQRQSDPRGWKKRRNRLAIAIAAVLGLTAMLVPIIVTALSHGYEWWVIAPVVVAVVLGVACGVLFASKTLKYLD